MTVHFFSDVPVQYGSWEEYDLMRPLDVKDPTVGTAAAFISNCAATNFRLQVASQQYCSTPRFCHYDLAVALSTA